MKVLTGAGIVLTVASGVVLFVVLPAAAAYKALPEIRRMRDRKPVPADRAPINTGRAITRALDRADAHTPD